VGEDNGLIHSVESTAARVLYLNSTVELQHGEETGAYDDAGSQGIDKRAEIEGKRIGIRVAMPPGKLRAVPDTPEGRMKDVNETAKTHIRAKGDPPHRLMKRKFDFQKTR